ncbi:MAG: hypothetical protein AB2L20_16575 [Mangrovibacterium sp.]
MKRQARLNSAKDWITKSWTPTDLLDEIIKEQANFSVYFTEDVSLDTKGNTIKESVQRLSVAMQTFTENHIVPTDSKSFSSVLWIGFYQGRQSFGVPIFFDCIRTFSSQGKTCFCFVIKVR